MLETQKRELAKKIDELEPHVFIPEFSAPGQQFHNLVKSEIISGEEPEIFPFEIERGYESGLFDISQDILSIDIEWPSKFSRDYIQDLVIILIKKLKIDGKKGKASQHLDELIQKLQNYNTENSVFIPLSGIKMGIPSFEIGNIILRNYDEKNYEELESHLGISEKDKNPKVARVPWDDMRKRFKVYAEFKAKSEPLRTIERAIEETLMVIDIFRYLIPCSYLPQFYTNLNLPGEIGTIHPDLTKMNVGFPDSISNDGLFMITKFNSFYSTRYYHIGKWIDFELSEISIPILEKHGISKLSSLLKDRANTTEFKKVLISGIHWFADAVAQRETAHKLMSLFICLELFLIKNDENRDKGDKIAGRASVITEEDIRGRRETRKTIKELYKIRNNVNHEGESIVSHDNYLSLLLIARDFLKKMIEYSDNMSNLTDLFSKIDSLTRNQT
jgi:hypothetical protein